MSDDGGAYQEYDDGAQLEIIFDCKAWLNILHP